MHQSGQKLTNAQGDDDTPAVYCPPIFNTIVVVHEEVLYYVCCDDDEFGANKMKEISRQRGTVC